jgi:signal transduction histidine kinase
MIIEAHGGHITLFSQPKEGSVFTFRLPSTKAVSQDALPQTSKVQG